MSSPETHCPLPVVGTLAAGFPSEQASGQSTGYPLTAPPVQSPRMHQRAAAESAGDAAAILGLLTRLLSENRLASARQLLAEQLAVASGAALVTVATVGAAERVEKSVAGSLDLLTGIEFAQDAAIGETLCFVRPLSASSQSKTAATTLAHRCLSTALRRQRDTAPTHYVWTLPLVCENDHVVGAIQWIWLDRATVTATQQAFLLTLPAPLAEALLLLERAQPSRWQIHASRWRRWFTDSRGLVIAMVLACCVALACVPVRYPVRAEVTLKPETQRVISAPFPGTVKQVFVTSGMTVTAGTPLFSLDEDDLRTRIAAEEAVRARESAQRSGHLAVGDAGAAELARLQIAKSSAEIQRLTKRLERAIVRAPIDGVVLGESLERLTGMPLETGAVTMEVAPLQRLLAKLDIPPDEIQWVRQGQRVRFRLDAVENLPVGTLQRVAPRGWMTARGLYRFEAIAEVDNQAGKWKPGMQGTADVLTQHRPWAWCWFQRIWRQVRSWM